MNLKRKNDIYFDPYDPDGSKRRSARRRELIFGIIIAVAIIIAVGLFFGWLRHIGLYDGTWNPTDY